MLVHFIRIPLFCLLFPSGILAAQLNGLAIHVSDGDTIIVMDDAKQKHRIRLASIDCPEKRQPWGNKAKRATSDLVGNRRVQVEWTKKDRYGRLIGDVFVDGQLVNRALVSEGHCWVYRKYNQDLLLYAAETTARLRHKGLWSLPESEQTPPWEWRRKH